MAVHMVHTNEVAATIVGIIGSIISGLVYLAPLPTYYRIYKKKSIQGFECVPYVVALFSAMLWLYYGVLKRDYFMLGINLLGCIVETIYIALYYVYAPQNARNCTAKLVFALNVGLFSLVVIVIQWIMEDNPIRVQALGYICALISTCVFGAPLTVLVKVIRTESVEYMPFTLSFFLTLSAVSWFVYGLLRHDLFISIPNILGVALGILQMLLYAVCKYCFSDSTNKLPKLKAKLDRTQVDCEQGSHQIEIQNKHSASKY